MHIIMLPFTVNPGDGLGIVRRHPVGRDKNNVLAGPVGMQRDRRTCGHGLPDEYPSITSLKIVDCILAPSSGNPAMQYLDTELIEALTQRIYHVTMRCKDDDLINRPVR